MAQNDQIQAVNEEVVELMERGSFAPSDHRRKINIQEVKDVFRKRNFRRGFSIFDSNKDGVIDIKELKDMIRELSEEVPPDVVRKILQMQDEDNDGYLNYTEFVRMVNNPQLNVLFGRYLRSYVRGLVPERRTTPFSTYGRSISVTVSEPDGVFEDQYSCWPPPVCMILISVIEIILYCVDMFKYAATEANGPMAVALMYNPHKRYEAWRYITYMFVHVGYMHLCVNLIVQIMLGIPLEMVHKGWRVLIIYFAGVIAGSLGTSLTDPSVYLAGASGGVYSLMTAHIASVIMVRNQHCQLEVKDNIGYEAHVAGALAGLLVGIFVLRNLDQNPCERKLWWISLVVYLAMMMTAIGWNVLYPSYFPVSHKYT